MKSRIEDSQKGKILVLIGGLCIQDADEFRTLLVQSIDTTDVLTIDVASVTEMDLSFLQLLCSAHRTAIEQNKRLELDKKWPEPCVQAIQESGYTHQAACGFNKNNDCMWTKGAN